MNLVYLKKPPRNLHYYSADNSRVFYYPPNAVVISSAFIGFPIESSPLHKYLNVLTALLFPKLLHRK